MATPDLSNIDPAQFARAMKALEMLEGQKHDVSSTTPAVGFYDTGGIGSYPYASPDIVSALQQPVSWIDDLSVRPSVVRDSVVQILTGLQAEVGTNPDDICGEPMTPGALKLCNVLTKFGELYLGTPTIRVNDVAMVDSYAVRPKRMVNGANATSRWVPDPLRGSFNANSETAIQLFKLMTAIRRSVATIEATGNITLTGGSRRTGWITEFDGLDRLLVPITDAATGTACPAASPLIEAWNGAIDASVNGLTLVQLMHDIWYAKNDLARDVGLENPQLTWIMDRRLFRQLVHVFACGYGDTRCAAGTAGNPIVITGEEIARRRNEMMNGSFLPIDGEPTPVKFTSGSEVDDATSTLDSSIYLIPLRPDLTYMEYYPYNSDAVTEFLREFGGQTVNARVANNGMYLLFNSATKGCFQLHVTGKFRLMMQARFLAARIDGVTFTSYVGYRDWDPAGSSFYNGGITVYDTQIGDIA
jgi:hypothetical protein